MSRMSHARFNDSEPICAIEVDDDFDSYEEKRDQFNCIFCGVQVQFSRGKDHNDPHFKNWPLKEHASTCIIPKIEKQRENFPDNSDVEILISTILPRAKRLNVSNHKIEINRATKARLFGGTRSKQFIYTLRNLLDERNLYNLKKEYANLEMMVEDGTTIKLVDLIGTQDAIIDRIGLEYNEHIFCLLKGTTKKAIKVGNNIKIPFTIGKNPKYKNRKGFSLFISWDYKEKNLKLINQIENCLVICYGESVRNEFGYEMEMFSIKHQIVILKKFS